MHGVGKGRGTGARLATVGAVFDTCVTKGEVGGACRVRIFAKSTALADRFALSCPMNIPRRTFLKVSALLGTGAALSRTVPKLGAAPAMVAPTRSDAAIPETYRHWQAQARTLLEPLVKLFIPGHASIAIAGPASANGANADRLETFARPLLLAAHYLQSVPETTSEGGSTDDFRSKVAQWFREGLIAGSAANGPQAWGPDANYHQLHVEMGLLSVSLQIAPEHLWMPLSPAQKDQVADWLGSARCSGYVNNNHYFMGIPVLEFLLRHGYGQPGDAAMVDEYFLRLETMHRGGGWFEDGINQAYDYYNAYAFNYYGLWWARLHGESNPARARRWCAWARSFTRDYEHFFASSGEHAAFGRSITYRFNSVAVFGLATLLDSCDLPPGRVRRLCTRNLDFFLRRPIFQEQGCLAIGWTDRFEASAELYTGAGSPYWAAKGFAALLLPPTHPFWTAPEEPLASEAGDHAHVIRPAGLVLRSTAGEVEILNAGSQISHVNLRYGAWKWSKTAYRTGTAFTCAFPAATNWSPDSALTARLEDGRVFGRHSTIALEMEESHLAYRWALGFAPDQFNIGVDTILWWRAGWLLQLHTFRARQPATLRLGGYALPLNAADCTRPSVAPLLAAWDSSMTRGTVSQPLHGFDGSEWDTRLDGSAPRAHLAAPFHATPIAVRKVAPGEGALAALSWTGTNQAEAAAWSRVATKRGAWSLTHPHLGRWDIRHPLLPSV